MKKEEGRRCSLFVSRLSIPLAPVQPSFFGVVAKCSPVSLNDGEMRDQSACTQSSNELERRQNSDFLLRSLSTTTRRIEPLEKNIEISTLLDQALSPG